MIVGSKLEHLSARFRVAKRFGLNPALLGAGAVSLTSRSWRTVRHKRLWPQRQQFTRIRDVTALTHEAATLRTPTGHNWLYECRPRPRGRGMGKYRVEIGAALSCGGERPRSYTKPCLNQINTLRAGHLRFYAAFAVALRDGRHRNANPSSIACHASKAVWPCAGGGVRKRQRR